MAFSNSTGETLTLPSPTHLRHVDVTKTVRSLRRSLSRSPSRFNLLRSASDASDCATAQSQSPSPASAIERRPNNQAHDDPAPRSAPIPLSLHSTNVSTPLRPNIKLSVRSIKSRPTPTRSTQRSRISPKSPLKRIFGDSPDPTEPATHFSVTFAGRDQENIDNPALPSPSTADSRRLLDKSSRHSLHLDGSDGLRLLSPKLFEGRNEALQALVSPLKRSDSLMDLEQSTSASPKAKRRSLHGLGSLGGDLSIFDQGSASQQYFNIHEDNHSLAREVAHVPGPDAAGTLAEASEAGASTAAPRKPSSLRRKTLQQRTADRRGHEETSAQALDSVASPIAKSRPRLSLDQYLPPGPRESPFQSPGNLLNPSVHLFDRPLHQPHPLSRSLTQSSSSSSVMDDSPSHIPLPVVERPRGPVNFSKSLPPGSSRPTQGFSEAVATPRYKSALPNQAAFMSTGLVSKKNWHLQLDATAPGNAPSVMPDTPCKKQVYSSNTYPPQSGSGRRRSRPSFGSPSTPFNPLLGGSFGTFGIAEKGSSLFKLPRSKHSRKASVFSVDGDDPTELLSLFDNEIPPTPTKNSIGKPATPAAQMHSSPIVQQVGIMSSAGRPRDGPPAPPISSPRAYPNSLPGSSPITPHEELAPRESVFPMGPTPQDTQVSQSAPEAQTSRPPATPTAHGQTSFIGVASRRPSLTPAQSYATSDLDEALLIRFDKSELVGVGEFSQVFRVIKYPRSASFAISLSTSSRLSAQTSDVEQVFAVKKSKHPFHGRKDRETKLREVAVLKALKHAEHVVQYVDSWEHNFHLYIQTEFCEEGSLDKFLRSVGTAGRLDDFRIWKILSEMTSGLNAIHGAGYMHLDLKPANVFITYDGSIKIGDFGIATRWPARHGIESEGDREYMAPEILKGQYDRPADVFSLGLILLEMACNVFLPDNGPTWQALREGDLSVVPGLTWDDAASTARDATGTPITYDTGVSPLNELEELEASNSLRSSTTSVQAEFPFGRASTKPSRAADVNSGNKRAELHEPPDFMADAANPGSLDNVAKWMLTPDPTQRPTAGQLLCLDSYKWVSTWRRAGATVFEGNWGPAELDATDVEMTGV